MAINRTSLKRGFTLIELLVVISIIALIVSLILPSLSGARRTGQRVACMAKMRNLGQGATQYATDNDDWIIGSPGGSGRYLAGVAAAYGPAVQRWDFMGPMAKMWGRTNLREVNSGDGVAAVAKRFNDIRSDPAFLCASNQFLANLFAGPNAGAGWMVSYNTTWSQLWYSPDAASSPALAGDSTVGLVVANGSHNEQLPAGWRPSVGRIGVPANKIFCADGARYSNGSTPPDYDLQVGATYGGTFSCNPPYFQIGTSNVCNSWDRSWAPGNQHFGSTDGRIYAYRHSTGQPNPGAPANAFKFNAVFFDGHVETQGDLESANPQQWLPKGTTLTAGNRSADVAARYGDGNIAIGG